MFAREVLNNHQEIEIEDFLKARFEFRDSACKLIAHANGIPFLQLLSIVNITPTQENILLGAYDLIGLSNTCGANVKEDLKKKFMRKLNINLNRFFPFKSEKNLHAGIQL